MTKSHISFRWPFTVALVLLLLSICGLASAVELLEGQVSFDKDVVQVGETITATWSVDGGSTPYKVNAYYWGVKEEGLENTIYRDSGSDLDVTSLSFTPTIGNQLRLELHIEDSEGRVLTFDNPWIVIEGAKPAAPLKGSVDFDKQTVSVGEPITARWRMDGGSPPYSVNTYYWGVREEGLDNTVYEDAGSHLDVESLTFIPSKGHQLRLELHIEDSEGRTLSFVNPWIPVSGATKVEPLTASVSIDKSDATIGLPVTASWEIQGGTPPYRVRTYYWGVRERGLANTIYEDSGSGGEVESLTFVPSKGVELRLELHLEDSENREVSYVSDWIPIRPQGVLAGDANANGKVDLQDLEASVNTIVSRLEPSYADNADANADGVFDVEDLIWMIGRIVK